MKEKHYLILDCETATLDFANEIAQGDEEKKKKIAIARPLIYDIGWTITNRKGNIIRKKQYLIAEIFSVPAIFKTAYYQDKRPIYLDMLRKGETTIKPWLEVAEELIRDMIEVEAVGAYNSMFDFKKAIPFTELYINKLYSTDYNTWYEIQRALCERIANQPYEKDPDKEFDPLNFTFRGVNYPLFDLWGLSVTHLLDRVKYREECLKHGLLTNSGIYFRTTAESSYQYLCKQFDFEEAHTALNDAEIETYIFSKIAMRHKVELGIKYFPYRALGYTDDYVLRRPRINLDYVRTISETIHAHIGERTEGNYVKGMLSRVQVLDNLLATAV